MAEQAENNPAQPQSPAQPEAKPEAQAPAEGQTPQPAEAAAKPEGQEKPKKEGKPGGEGRPKGEGKGKAKGEGKGKEGPKERKPIPKPRLMIRFQQEILPGLREALNKSNAMAAPRLSKVVVSMGLGKAVQEGGAKSVETKRFQDAMNQLSTIVGQKPVITRARKSVSQFKVREGWPVGMKVTLRGARMWEFLDRLINLAIPRIRDFRGLDPKGFDGRGNYNMGVTEQSVFPEIDASQITYQQGMNVTICTTGKNDTEAFELLRRMGRPFRALGGPCPPILAPCGRRGSSRK